MQSHTIPHILHSLHKRISILEHLKIPALNQVADVQVPSRQTELLKSQSQECVTTFTSTGYSAFCRTHFESIIDKCMIWHNTRNSDIQCRKVEITREIAIRDESNAMETLNGIFLGVYYFTYHASSQYPVNASLPVVIKMRQVNSSTEHLTEKEVQHMINTSQDDLIKHLFPNLYFVMSMKDMHGNTWECTGIDPLSEMNLDINIFLPEAFLLLQGLHQAGYTHGDPHMGNFMIVPEGSRLPHLTPHRLIFIDQDNIQKLPSGPHNVALANLLIINDLNTLLFVQNPLIRFWQHTGQVEWRKIFKLLYEMPEKPSTLRTPIAFFDIRESSVAQIEVLLDQYPVYKQYLETLTMPYIHQMYQEILHNPQWILETDMIYKDYLMKKGIKYNASAFDYSDGTIHL